MAEEPLVFPQIHTHDDAIVIDDEVAQKESANNGTKKAENDHVEPLSTAFIRRVQKEQKEKERVYVIDDSDDENVERIDLTEVCVILYSLCFVRMVLHLKKERWRKKSIKAFLSKSN